MLKKKIYFKKTACAVICLIFGMLLSECRMMGFYAPFGAVLPAILPLPFGAAALLGTVLSGAVRLSVGVIPLAAASGAALIQRLRPSGGGYAVSSAVTAGVYFMSASALEAFSGGSFADFLCIGVISAGLCAVIYIFSYALREAGAVRGVADAALVFMAACAACALCSVTLGPVSLGGIFAGYAAIFAAGSLGAAPAAAVSLACSVGAGLCDPSSFAEFALIGVPALICGRFLFGRPIAVAACTAGLYLPLCVIFGSGGSLGMFVGVAVAAALYVPTQRFAAAALGSVRERRRPAVKAARCLETYFSAMEDLEDRLSGLSGQPCPESRPLSDVIKTKVCISCPKSQSCFDGSSSFSALDSLGGEPRLADVICAVPVCSRAPEVRRAGAEAYRRREYAVAKTSERLSAVRLGACLISAFESALCDAEGFIEDIRSVDDLLSRRLRASLKRAGVKPERCLVMRGGRIELSVPGSARINGMRAASLSSEVTGFEYGSPERVECGDSAVLRLIPVPEFEVNIGFSQLCAKNNSSGDVVDSFESAGFSYLLLSDGMGVGEQAHAAASLLVENVRRLICAGFSVETSVRFGSSVLKCMLPEESFATLDILRVNLRTGAAEVCKAGGFGSTLILDGEESSLQTGGFPVGILDGCRLKVHRFYVRESATLVMMTDGAIALSGQSLRGALSDIPDCSLFTVSEKLIARALGENSAQKDDMTVCTVRIQRKSL